jgi:hypothetical protein
LLLAIQLKTWMDEVEAAMYSIYRLIGIQRASRVCPSGYRI